MNLGEGGGGKEKGYNLSQFAFSFPRCTYQLSLNRDLISSAQLLWSLHLYAHTVLFVIMLCQGNMFLKSMQFVLQ